jgi:predicted GNAT family acetyltransferase
MAIEVRFDPTRSRWEADDDGQVVGVADIRVQGDRVVFTHTFVPPARRGEGIAEQIVATALDDVRRRGAVAVPHCWYVAEFIRSHPDYGDLLAPRSIHDATSESIGTLRSPAMRHADVANGERQDDA